MVLQSDLGPRPPSQIPFPMSFVRWSPFTNTSGTITTSLPDTSGLSTIKAGVISMLFRINAADAGVTTTNNINLTFTSKPLCVGAYSLYFYMPITTSNISGDNYSALTQSATIGSGIGIAIQHASTASECYCLYVNTSVSAVTIDENQWILIQAGINWNDLANSFIWINGAVIPSNRLSTAQTTKAAVLGISPITFTTTTTTTQSLDIGLFCASTFDITQGATLATMCRALYDPASGGLNAPNSAQWQIVMSNINNTMTNSGNLGGTVTPSGGPTTTYPTPSGRLSYNVPAGSRYYAYATPAYGGTIYIEDPSWTGDNAYAAPSTDDNLYVVIYSVTSAYSYGTPELFVPSVNNPATNNISIHFYAGANGTNYTQIVPYMAIPGAWTRSTIISGSVSYWNGQTILLLIRGGTNMSTGGLWTSVNKTVQAMTTSTAAPGAQNYSTHLSVGAAQTALRNYYFIGYWSSNIIAANPQIPWDNGTSMTNYFLKADGQTIVDDPSNAINNIQPLFSYDPNYTNQYALIGDKNQKYPLIATSTFGSASYYAHRKLRTTPLIIGQP